MPIKLGLRDLSTWLRRGGDILSGRPVPFNDYVQPVEIVGDSRLLTSHQQPTSAFGGQQMATTAPDNDAFAFTCWSNGALVQEITAQHSAAAQWYLCLFPAADLAVSLAGSNVAINVMHNDPPVRCTLNALVIPAIIDVTRGATKAAAANGTVAWSNIFVPPGTCLVVGPDSAVGIPTGFARWSCVWSEFPG